MVVALGCLADAATMMLAGTLDPQKVHSQWVDLGQTGSCRVRCAQLKLTGSYWVWTEVDLGF